MSQRRVVFMLGSVWALALILYALTLAPTYTWAHFGADGGDLISAAVTHGVPHPMGYPTYLALGALVASVPVGSVALRFNLLSALCMAGAATLLTWALWRAVGRGRVAVLGGLTFAAAPLVWSQAVIAEVHALNALFFAAIVLLSGNTTRRARLAAFGLWGLGLGNHVTLIFLAPVMIYWLVVNARSAAAKWRDVAESAGMLLAGLSIYGLLPLFAASQPPVNWLGEWKIDRVWEYLTLYRAYVFGLSANEVPARVIEFVGRLVQQVGVVGVGVAVLGAWRRSVWGLTAALYVIFALGYAMPDAQVYLIPVMALTACAVALGAQRLEQWPRLRGRASLVLLLLVPGVSVIVNFATLNLSADRTTETFAQAVWQRAPAQAIVVTHTDADTFALWYYRLVERQRSDVAIVDQRLAAFTWYRPMLTAQGQAPVLPPIDPEDTWAARLRAANPDRVVCDVPAMGAMVCR